MPALSFGKGKLGNVNFLMQFGYLHYYDIYNPHRKNTANANMCFNYYLPIYA